MSQPLANKSVRIPSPLVTLLRELVVPVFEEQSNPADDAPGFELIEPESGEHPFVRGHLGEGHLIHIQALPHDDVRTILRICLLTGHFIDSAAGPALLVGNLLEFTPFHVRADCQLGYHGRMSVSCDLMGSMRVALREWSSKISTTTSLRSGPGTAASRCRDGHWHPAASPRPPRP